MHTLESLHQLVARVTGRVGSSLTDLHLEELPRVERLLDAGDGAIRQTRRADMHHGLEVVGEGAEMGSLGI